MSCACRHSRPRSQHPLLGPASGHGSRTTTGAQPEMPSRGTAWGPLEHPQKSPTAGTHLMHRTARLRLMKRVYSDARSDGRIQHHYEVERALADRLRGATGGERRRLYATLYDELFEHVPDHPQLSGGYASDRRYVQNQVRLLSRFLQPSDTFLEIGAGDCRLSLALAAHTRYSHAMDVTDSAVHLGTAPKNFRFLLSDGVSVPLETASVDVAYSNQLLEHLHPDDAGQQLDEVSRILTSTGLYICVTPNAVTGPHDVSRYFDEVPRGFHMHEYRCTEISALFLSCGFKRVSFLLSKGGWHFGTVPLRVAMFLEALVSTWPTAMRKSRAAALLTGIYAIAGK